MSSPIAQLVLDKIVQRMSDVTTGFNATYNAAAVSYGLVADMAVGFDATKPVDFFLGDFDPIDLLDGTIKFPFVTTDVKMVRNANHEKFRLFSGPVAAFVNVFLSCPCAGLPCGELSLKGNLLCEVLVDLFNRLDNQDWGDDVVWNGDIDVAKTAIAKVGDRFWMTAVKATLTFEQNN